MRKPIVALLFGVAVSCSGTASTDYPEWRWKDPEEPVIVDDDGLLPALVDAGWCHVSSQFAAVPDGISVYRSPETIEGVKVIAYLAIADLSKMTWDVRSISDPTITGTSEALQTPSEWFSQSAAPILINGGYFFAEGGKRYNASVAVSGGKTYGVNINYASEDWETMYYPTRGVFYCNEGAAPETGWTYWSGGAKHYLYSEPAQNSWSKDPLQVPDSKFPTAAKDFAPLTAIGGGPVLIKGGEVVNTWEAELLYGDGADDKMPNARHPRTAIGYMPNGYLVLFVCEGRGMTEGVAGMTFAEEAALLKAIGCTEALNLDGGGSSCLLVQGTETIKVSDGEQRPVASVVIVKAK